MTNATTKQRNFILELQTQLKNSGITKFFTLSEDATVKDASICIARNLKLLKQAATAGDKKAAKNQTVKTVKNDDEQTALKKLYHEELKKVWSSEKMIDYCTKKVEYIIEHKGKLYEIEKPTIKTRFCFGHGMFGRSTPEEEDAAAGSAQNARTNQQFFIDENLEEINRWIKQLKEIKQEMGRNWAQGNMPVKMIGIGAHYISQSADCKLNYYSVVRSDETYKDCEINHDIELIDKLIKGYETVKSSFIKRLETYLKKYGLSKLDVWTYLVD